MGLDLSLTGTGVVVLRGDDVLHRELIHTEPKMGSQHMRINLIACTIAELAREHEPDLVGIEGYAFGKMHNSAPLMEVGGVVKHYLFHEECPWTTLPPQSLKVYALGEVPKKPKKVLRKDWGKQVKEMMVQAARDLGCKTYDDNVADAFHLARWARDGFTGLISDALETVA